MHCGVNSWYLCNITSKSWLIRLDATEGPRGLGDLSVSGVTQYLGCGVHCFPALTLFFSSFQGYEGSLIKLTSKQVCKIFLSAQMNPTDEGNLSVSQRAAARITANRRSSTPNISSVSLLTCAPPPPPHPPPDFEDSRCLTGSTWKKKVGMWGLCWRRGKCSTSLPLAVRSSACSRRQATLVGCGVFFFFFFRGGGVSFSFPFFFLTRAALTVVFCLRGR